MIGQRSLTYKELQDEVLTLMGFAGVSGNMRDLVKQQIRVNHDNRVVMGDHSFMVFPYPTTFTLTAGRRDYALHPAFRLPIYFRSRTSGKELIERPSDMLSEEGLLSDTARGSAGDFQLRGVLTVSNQPQVDGVVTVSSTGSDSAQSVTVTGETAAGVVEETITLSSGTGTTTFLANGIYGVRKNGTGWNGTLTVNVAGTPVLTLGAEEYGREFRHLQLLRTPDTAEVIEYGFYRHAARLEEDNDIPSIPTPFSRILVYDTLLDLQGYARWTGGEAQRFSDMRIELQHALDSTFQEGHSNGASASFVHYIPR